VLPSFAGIGLFLISDVMNFFNRFPRLNQSVPEPGGGGIDFDALLRFSMEELLLKTQTHQELWLFGQEEQWNLDPGQTELAFAFPGRLVTAPAQVIGTYDRETPHWTWGWADASVPENLAAHAHYLKQFGEQNGIARLTTPDWAAEETDCWYMVALACHLCGFHGAYRAPSEKFYSFISFGQVEVNPALEARGELLKSFVQESAGDFRTCADSLEQQRLACCRYFRRGSLVGFSQQELIDSLALAARSVLDDAGYSPDAADRVMDMIGGISDEEIQSS